MDISVPALPFASGWANVGVAAGSSRSDPQTNRTTLVEFFSDEGVQLTATDNTLLCTTSIPSASDPLGINPPSIHELPGESIIVMDPGGRMRTLMGWTRRVALAAEKEGGEVPPIRLQIRSGERPAVPTLSPDLERQILVVTTERERLDLALYEGSFVDWRPLLLGHSPSPTATVAFSPTLLARLGKLRSVAAGIEFTFAGKTGGARFEIDSDPPLIGLVMPVHAADVADEVDVVHELLPVA